jgi:hypothetical protein
MRLTESASNRIADRLKDATSKNSEEEEIGETDTPNLAFTNS